MKRILVYFLLSSLFFACNSTEKKETERQDTLVFEATDTTELSSIIKVFHTVPSPLETALLFEEAGLTYPGKILSPYKNAPNFNTSFSIAINLGIYGTDLSFCSIFEKTQECIYYMNASKILAEKLDIASAIPQELIDRMERNIGNRDTFYQVITEVFWATDHLLKENKRDEVAALVLAGGWIEGLYLGCEMAFSAKKENKKLLDKIAEQKLSYEHLIKLLSAHQSNPETKSLIEKLSPLTKIYEEIMLTTTPSDTLASQKNNKGNELKIIGGTSTLTYSSEQMKSLYNEVKNIRNTLISL